MHLSISLSCSTCGACAATLLCGLHLFAIAGLLCGRSGFISLILTFPEVYALSLGGKYALSCEPCGEIWQVLLLWSNAERACNMTAIGSDTQSQNLVKCLLSFVTREIEHGWDPGKLCLHTELQGVHNVIFKHII